MHPNRRWRAWRSRARSPRMHHASYPVFVHRPAVSDWTSSRPRLATTPLPFSLPSALRKPGHRTFTYEVTRHARRTRLRSGALRGLIAQRPLHRRVGRRRQSAQSATRRSTAFCYRATRLLGSPRLGQSARNVLVKNAGNKCLVRHTLF